MSSFSLAAASAVSHVHARVCVCVCVSVHYEKPNREMLNVFQIIEKLLVL